MNEVITIESPVPFGKYRGQPMAVLIADRNYCDWILGQGGLRDRYPEIISYLHNGEETNSTPEHNKLQARFLDAEFRAAFDLLRWPYDWCSRKIEVCGPVDPAYVRQPHCDYHAYSNYRWRSENPSSTSRDAVVIAMEAKRKAEEQAAFIEAYQALVPRGVWVQKDFRYRKREIAVHENFDFERGGWDVLIGDYARIECKPTLSDEYPAVLRQMRSRDRSGNDGQQFLVAGEFRSAAITLPQMRLFFRQANIRLVLLQEVEAAVEALRRDWKRTGNGNEWKKVSNIDATEVDITDRRIVWDWRQEVTA